MRRDRHRRGSRRRWRSESRPRSDRSRYPRRASAKAQAKIATLRKYYELGRRASDTAPDGTPKTPEPLKALAAEAGVEEDTIRKALKFATTYTADELEELLALRDADGDPLNWYRVRVLLQVQGQGRAGGTPAGGGPREAGRIGTSRRRSAPGKAARSRPGGGGSPCPSRRSRYWGA